MLGPGGMYTGSDQTGVGMQVGTYTLIGELMGCLNHDSTIQ